MKMHTCEPPPHTNTSMASSKDGIAVFTSWHFICLTLTSLEVLLFNCLLQNNTQFLHSISESYLKWASRQAQRMKMWPFETHRDRFILFVNCLPGSQVGGGEERDQPSHIQVRL